jgi:deazaflavin-dependent oxidoreductase (nitroreductase family)
MADTTPSQPDAGNQRRSGSGAEPSGQASATGGGSSRPARQFRPSRWRRVGDAIIGMFARVGLVPSTYLLTTRGRKTGRPLTHPVTVVQHDGRRWLVAPYGPVSWVHNARAAGRVSVGRRGDRRDYAIREVPAEEAGPVLSATSASPPPPGRTSRRIRAPRWKTSSPRRTATRCSSFSRSARIAMTVTVVDDGAPEQRILH